MKAKFSHLRTKFNKFSKNAHPVSKTFAGALFTSLPWFLHGDEESPKVEAPPASEKVEVISSLKNYVEEKTEQMPKESKKISFDDGEVKIKDEEFSVPRIEIDTPAPELALDDEKDVMVLGYLLQKGDNAQKNGEINATVDRLIQNSGLSDFRVDRKPGLRNYVSKWDDPASKEVVERFFNYIYKHKVRVVVALGAFDTGCLVGRRERMAQIHGKFIEREIHFNDDVSYRFKIVPTFQPEYIQMSVTNGSTTQGTVVDDLKGVSSFLST